jgi:methyl-accepting chemotaxis protein
VVIAPLSRNRTLLGFKPRSWEQALISEQDAQIGHSVESLRTVLMAYLGGGLILAVIFPLIIVFMTSRPLNRATKAFEQLSLGDFDSELSPAGGKSMASLADSFFRLKTSLKIALGKLGSR